MVRRIYAIYDKLAKDIVNSQYLMMFPNDTVASRVFVDMVNANPKESAVAAHPDDYSLICLGSLCSDSVDNDTGISLSLENFDFCEVVITGKQVKDVADPNAGVSGMSRVGREQLEMV